MDIKINVEKDCEGVMSRLPSGYGMELLEENYGEAPDFENNWILISVDEDFPVDSINSLDGVTSYEILE